MVSLLPSWLLFKLGPEPRPFYLLSRTLPIHSSISSLIHSNNCYSFTFSPKCISFLLLLQQTQCLKTTHIYSCIILEVKSLKSWCWQGYILEGSGENRFFAFPDSSIPWLWPLPPSLKCITPDSDSIVISPFQSLTLFLCLQIPCNYIGPIQIIRNNVPISRSFI